MVTQLTRNLGGLALVALSSAGCLDYPRNGQTQATKSTPVEFEGYTGNAATMIPQIFNTSTGLWEPIPNATAVSGGAPYVDSASISWYKFSNPSVTLPSGSQYWVAGPNQARNVTTQVRVVDGYGNLLNTFDQGVSESNCPVAAGFDVANNCKSAQSPNVTLNVPCGAPGATCCLSGARCDFGMCSAGMCPAIVPSQWDTFTYKPLSPTPIVIKVAKGMALYSNGAYHVPMNAAAYIQCSGAVNLPLPVGWLTLTSASHDPSNITDVTGSLASMPDLGGVAWPGALEGMVTKVAGAALNFTLIKGSDFNDKGLPLQVAPDRYFINLVPSGALPSIGFGGAVMSSIVDDLQNQAQILFDPSAPGIAVYGSMTGNSFMGIEGAGFGISAARDFHFDPLYAEDLPVSSIPTFDGAMFIGGSATIRDVNVTGSAVVDLGTSLSKPGPVRLGFNGTATVGIPIVSDFTGIELTVGEVTYFHEFDKTADFGYFDGIGGLLTLSGLGFEYDLDDYFSVGQARAWGKVSYHGGALDLGDSYANLELTGASMMGGAPITHLGVSISQASGVVAAGEINAAFTSIGVSGAFNSSGVTLTGTGSIHASVSASVSVPKIASFNVSASVTGQVSATVSTNGASYGVGSGGKVKVCANGYGGACVDVAASTSTVGGLPKLCIPNISLPINIPKQCSGSVCALGVCTPNVCVGGYSYTVHMTNKCFNP